jgi:hypothetical protein
VHLACNRYQSWRLLRGCDHSLLNMRLVCNHSSSCNPSGSYHSDTEASESFLNLGDACSSSIYELEALKMAQMEMKRAPEEG